MSSITSTLVTNEFESWTKVEDITFNVHFNGFFMLGPLKYQNAKHCELRLPYSKVLLFKEMNEYLLDETKQDIWKWFYCNPSFCLEKGLTIVEHDSDIRLMFDLAQIYGHLDLYVCHRPQVYLVDYYFENLGILYESIDEVNSPYNAHIKAKRDADTMSFEEIVEWEKKELQSPTYLRSPHVSKYHSVGIGNGEGKNLLSDFDDVSDGKHNVSSSNQV